MEEIKADIVVIGSGPSGQKAAIQAAKLGKKVVVIEMQVEPGGNCLYNGTIPSKTLREAIIDLTRFDERHFMPDHLLRMERITISDLTSRLYKVIEEERNLLSRQFKKNKIQYIEGNARFENPYMIIVIDKEFRLSHQINSDIFIIATGSQPRNPTGVPFDNQVILDSTRLLGIDKIPQTMLVLGGGIIGSEYASFFAALGTEVTIIDKRDHILPLLDPEIGIVLQTALTDLGLKFKGNKEPLEIRKEGDKAVVKYKDGSSMTAECLLYALGRQANVGSLHIENAGLSVNENGYLPVNSLFQTKVQHIYAVGDVIGGASLASTSMEQGRLAARQALGVDTHPFPGFYPVGIYTIPEISSIGYTEDSLKELGFRYEVGRAYYYELARSHITGDNVGLFKILFHPDTLEILGVHIIGRGATELIHIGQIAISFHAKLDYFIDQIFNYPTYAEGYRVAALNGINKVKHYR